MEFSKNKAWTSTSVDHGRFHFAASAIASGDDLAISATFLNKNLYSFIARKEIRTPADLKGTKIGIAAFGGANQFSVVTFALAPWKIKDYYGTKHKGPGMDHIGFKVESLESFKKDVEILSKADPEWLAPKSANLESEYNVILGLLQRCRYGKHQLPDPEGNLIDVSE